MCLDDENFFPNPEMPQFPHLALFLQRFCKKTTDPDYASI